MCYEFIQLLLLKLHCGLQITYAVQSGDVSTAERFLLFFHLLPIFYYALGYIWLLRCYCIGTQCVWRHCKHCKRCLHNLNQRDRPLGSVLSAALWESVALQVVQPQVVYILRLFHSVAKWKRAAFWISIFSSCLAWYRYSIELGTWTSLSMRYPPASSIFYIYFDLTFSKHIINITHVYLVFTHFQGGRNDSYDCCQSR